MAGSKIVTGFIVCFWWPEASNFLELFKRTLWLQISEGRRGRDYLAAKTGGIHAKPNL